MKKYYKYNCQDCGRQSFGKRCRSCYVKSSFGHSFREGGREKGVHYKNYNNGSGWIERGYKTKKINGRTTRVHNVVWCSQSENLSYIPNGFEIHHHTSCFAL